MRKMQFHRFFGIALCAALSLSLFGCENPFRNLTAQTADVSKADAIQLPALTQEDTVQEIDLSNAEEIRFTSESVSVTDGAVASGTRATVRKAGTYLVTGACADGQLVVDAGDNDTVCLVFQNVTLESKTSAAVYVKNAGKTVLNAAKDTVNILSDAAQYQNQTDGEPDAAVFSKDDLTVNGLGTFQITGNYQDAVKSKDTLCITGSTLTVQSADDGLCGKDFVCIYGGSLSVTANGDGVKSSYDTDTKKGAVAVLGGEVAVTAGNDGFRAVNKVQMDGGTVTVASGDDGVHADRVATVSGGCLEITESYEGLEAAWIRLQGGEVRITASDDGVNASGGSQTAQSGGKAGGDPFAADASLLEITGGKLVVDASGDGLDSNGDISMSGGEVYIYGPTDGGNGAIDYAGTFTATGGTLFAAGSAEMAQSISDSSDVCAVAIGVEAQENTAVRLLRADGSAICSFVPKKRFSHLVIVSPEIQTGESYTVQTAQFSGGTNADGLLSDAVYTDETEIGTFTAQTGSVPVGNAGGGFGKFGGGQHGGTPNGEQPHDLPQNANPPDGNVPAPNGGERPNAENRPNRGAPQENG